MPVYPPLIKKNYILTNCLLMRTIKVDHCRIRFAVVLINYIEFVSTLLHLKRKNIYYKIHISNN